VTARRPRRRRNTPAPALPRPAGGEAVSAPIPTTPSSRRSAQPREHHVTRDYSYVRGDLLWVIVVTAITLGLIVGVWALSPSW